MSYLKDFPTINYKGNILTDITRKVIINDDIKNNASLWSSYTVQDGEYPEDVAYNFYGSTDHINIVLLMNDIIDPFFGWVLASNILDEYIADKYTDKNDIHHYVKNGIVVNKTVSGAIPITNYDYEFAINESKRKIRILNPTYLNDLLDEMNKKINQINRDV